MWFRHFQWDHLVKTWFKISYRQSNILEIMCNFVTSVMSVDGLAPLGASTSTGRKVMTKFVFHYIDVIMATLASQITSSTVVYSTVHSDADQRKHQSSASLSFVWGIHRTGEFPAQRASYTENVSIWWRHHAICIHYWHRMGHIQIQVLPLRGKILRSTEKT